MKKNRFVITTILIVTLILIGLFLILKPDQPESIGRYIRTSAGSHMILLENSPIIMSNHSESENLFDGLNTGDEIKISHGDIQESYPGGTGVYSCKLVSKGSIDDIPKDMIESLSSMGYFITDNSGKTREIYVGSVLSYEPVYEDEGNYLLKLKVDNDFEEKKTLTVVHSSIIQSIDDVAPGDWIWVECISEGSEEYAYREVVSLIEYQTVSYEYEYSNMSLELPAGWIYEINEYKEDAASYGINFWPADQSEGRIRLEFYPYMFGVCGTGLNQEEIRLGNGLWAYQGTYDDHEIWDFISIKDLPGDYVITNENVDGWWDAYGEQAMDIINSIKLAEGIVWENESIEIASQALKGEFEADRATFDFCEGNWNVHFTDQETQYTVYVGADGTVQNTSTFNPNEALAAKPVIYLYPEEETLVTVQLDFDGTLTTTYPAYQDGWTVIAQPDGTLIDPDTGREHYCLFWEGTSDVQYDVSTGFVVAGKDTAAFLEESLAEMGLTEKEANEFIIYWLPQMEGNEYNLISFQQESYTDSAALTIDPVPDSILRVFMAWTALEDPIEIEPQEFGTFERAGFAVVEWGGVKLR